MGNVGGTAAKLMYELGAKIIAVSDISGGLYCESGLDISDIINYINSNNGRKLLEDYPISGNVKRITNEELLTCNADILIPAAMENQVTEKIAGRVSAKIIIEAANGPTTFEADKILEDKRIIVVPDILANAGGVTVSYFEWVQNNQAVLWNEETINSKLKDIMIEAFNEVFEKASEKNTTLRMGAYMVALERLVKAKKMRGIFP